MSDKAAHRDALPPGTRLREFELLEVLGRGGFGITYRGWYPNLDVNVAIKEYMPSDFAVRGPGGNIYPKTSQSEEWYHWGLEKFIEEARTLHRFNHPSIVRVLQFFEGHGTAYMVMEYLEGRTMFALLNEQKTLNEARIRALLDPILDGLERVHAAGYLHRDIKPGNIVFRDEDTPVLIDFGAAYALTAERSRTVAAFETEGFSPIEQYAVTGQNYGPWTDLYAVGAVLYRGMTELVPVGALSRIERDDLASVGRVAKRKYSRNLTGAVDWALKFRAADRPQSIAQWRRVVEGRASPPRSRGGSTTHDRGKIVAALVMAATLVIAAGVWWRMEQPAPDPLSMLVQCRSYKSERKWVEALVCVRQVLAGHPDNVEARDEERDLAMLVAFSTVHDAPSVEGYYRFVKDYPQSPFVDVAKQGLKELENSYWEEVKAADTTERYLRYLEIYPEGRYMNAAHEALGGHETPEVIEARRRLSGGG